MVVPSVGVGLYVDADHVDIGFFEVFEVVYHGLVRRRGEYPVRPVSLVERAELEYLLSVQAYPRCAVAVRPDLYFPHPEVCLDPVSFLAVAPVKGEFHVIEVRVLR